MKILIVYYSTYGHVHQMAEAMAEGARQVKDAEVELRRVPETLTDEILEKMGALEAQKAFAHIPVCTVEELASADAIIFGTPTRFGNMLWPDAPVSGCHRPALVGGGTGGQGWKRIRQHGHPCTAGRNPPCSHST